MSNREVSDNAAEGDRAEKKRLELFGESHVHQNAAYEHHDDITHGQGIETRVMPQSLEGCSECVKNTHIR